MSEPPFPLTEEERAALIASARRRKAASVVVETVTGVTPTGAELDEYLAASAAHMKLLAQLVDKYSVP
jgi:hypothetical protein